MPPDPQLRSRRPTTEPLSGPARLDAAGVGFTVSPEARTVRRQLGPVAWAVLEDALCDVDMDASGRLTARTSVRRVAASLGVSKDTAARALTRLLELGLLIRHGGARAGDGTFSTGSYEVLMDRLDGVTLAMDQGRRPSATASDGHRRRRAARPQRQTALFDLDEATP